MFPHAVGPGSTSVVLVFRQIGELGEVAEGTDHQDGAARAEALEDVLQVLPRLGILGPVEAHGTLSDPLDEQKSLVSFLFPDRISQQPPQQADVLLQGQILVGVGRVHGSVSWGVGGGTG